MIVLGVKTRRSAAILCSALLLLANMRVFAGPDIILEAESGTLAGRVGVINDSTASGSQYIMFTEASTSQTGVWSNVTPSNMPLSGGTCDSYGVSSPSVDPHNSSVMYVMADCAGIWKSTDYGVTWTGPIETGTNGTLARDCAGGIATAPGTSGNTIIYRSCIRGQALWAAATGVWRSTDGGVNWTHIPVSGGTCNDYYPPVVNPYDGNHVILTGHHCTSVAETTDGGQTWRRANTESGMVHGGSAAIYFINTGNATTTRTTWLWIGEATGGSVGTWRTANSGASWTRVNSFEKPHGASQAYQPGNGVIFVGSIYGSSGNGIYRSADYGQTWTLVTGGQGAVVWGTPSRVYAAYSWACGGCDIDPEFRSAAQPGVSGWGAWNVRPAGMLMGPSSVAVTFDGTNHVFISGNWRNGLWRYIEP